MQRKGVNTICYFMRSWHWIIKNPRYSSWSWGNVFRAALKYMQHYCRLFHVDERARCKGGGTTNPLICVRSEYCFCKTQLGKHHVSAHKVRELVPWRICGANRGVAGWFRPSGKAQSHVAPCSAEALVSCSSGLEKKTANSSGEKKKLTFAQTSTEKCFCKKCGNG